MAVLALGLRWQDDALCALVETEEALSVDGLPPPAAPTISIVRIPLDAGDATMAPIDVPGSLREASLVAVAAMLIGCGACGEAHAPDGGDGGRDAGRDGGRDAGRRDAGRDGGGDGGPDDPEWVVPAGLPAGCRFEVARHPERIPAFTWEPCFDGRAGCQDLRVDWGDWRVIDTLRVNTDGFSGLGQPLVLFFRPTPEEQTQLLEIKPEDGRTHWASRFDLGISDCRPAPAALGRAGGVVRALRADSDVRASEVGLAVSQAVTRIDRTIWRVALP